MLANLALLLMIGGATTQPESPQEKPKLVCRESEQQLGSHIRSSRRCKTAEEWQIEDQRRDLKPPSMRVTEGQGDALTPKTRPQ